MPCRSCGGPIGARRRVFCSRSCAIKGRRERTRRHVAAWRRRTNVGVLPPPSELAAPEPRWRERASCRGLPPELWLPDRGANADRARATCATCPVRSSCTTWALTETDVLAGIIAGTSPRQRRVWRTRYGIRPPPKPTVDQIVGAWAKQLSRRG